VIPVDTEVVSELMRSKPDRNVLLWLDVQDDDSFYLSAVSLAQLLLAIESLPEQEADSRKGRFDAWGMHALVKT
jgi:hypothetical protein